MLESNKEIYKLDLAITTSCNFRCRYCFVKKTDEVIDFKTAKVAINLLISSPGKKKMLIIYGGEPLLYTRLVKEIILFAEKTASSFNKNILISLGTNGVLANKEFSSFLHKHNVKFCFSMDGKKNVHDANRKFRNGRVSFKRLYQKIPLILNELKNENVCVLLGVHPYFASKLFESYRFIVEQGITSMNIEPIQSVSWPENKKRIFLINLIKISKFILDNLKQRKFFFINSVNKVLVGDNFGHQCPFYHNIEFYPSGDLTFSGFLMNSGCKERYLIGDIKSGFFGKYSSCEFKLDSIGCRNCKSNYFKVNDPNSDMYELRNLISLRLAKHIHDISKGNPLYRDYIREAKKRIFE